jgi:hypothetical protein
MELGEIRLLHSGTQARPIAVMANTTTFQRDSVVGTFGFL